MHLSVYKKEHSLFNYWKLAGSICITMMISFAPYKISAEQNTESSITMLEHYQTISDADFSASPEKVESAKDFIKTEDNNYTILVAIKLAKYFITQKAWLEAEKVLTTVATKDKDENLVNSVHFSLAKIAFQLNKIDDAFALLDNIKSNGWIGIVEDLKGDIWVYKNDIVAAKEAYNKALNTENIKSLAQLLKVKIDNLPN